MSRSLSSSLLGVLALTLVVLQGVLAFIEPGRYLILTEDNRFLSIGPVPLVYPPPDVPARLFDRRFHDEAWEVKEVEGGYTIHQLFGSSLTYGLIKKKDAVFVSVREDPQVLAVDEAGDNLYTIGTVYEDLLFTQTPDKSLQVHLQPALGSNKQRWQFVPIERYSRDFGSLYGKSRFNSQCAM